MKFYPLDTIFGDGSISADKRSYVGVSGSTGYATNSFLSKSSGKWYFEFKVSNDIAGGAGVINAARTKYVLYADNSVSNRQFGGGVLGSSSDSFFSSACPNVWLGMGVDFAAKRVVVIRNAIPFLFADAYMLNGIFNGEKLYPVVGDLSGAVVPTVAVNFGDRPFLNKIPRGFLPWGTPQQYLPVDRKSLLSLPVARGGGF